MTAGSQVHYLNTDLDLIAPHNLAPLATALKAKGVIALSVTPRTDGHWYATFEYDDNDGSFDEPEKAIGKMLDAIESLKRDCRAFWSICTLREFNLGFECGDEPWAFNNGLTSSTLSRIAKAGATLRITIYPVRRAVTRRRKTKRKAPR